MIAPVRPAHWEDDDPCRQGHTGEWKSVVTRHRGRVRWQRYCLVCKRKREREYRPKHLSLSSMFRPQHRATSVLPWFTECAVCGSDYPHYVIEWDHLPGFDKANNLGRLSGPDAYWEINKCQPVCANCHTIRTHERASGACPHDGATRPDLAEWVACGIPCGLHALHEFNP